MFAWISLPGTIHWVPQSNHHQHHRPLTIHPFASMATTRLEPDRNYLTSIKGLTPITETSVEETQTSTEVNDESSTPLLAIANNNGSCVTDQQPQQPQQPSNNHINRFNFLIDIFFFDVTLSLASTKLNAYWTVFIFWIKSLYILKTPKMIVHIPCVSGIAGQILLEVIAMRK